MGNTGTRRIGNHNYYAYLEYKTKTKAKNRADKLRKQGYEARVYKMGGGWVVYATDKPVLTYSGKQRRK